MEAALDAFAITFEDRINLSNQQERQTPAPGWTGFSTPARRRGRAGRRPAVTLSAPGVAVGLGR